jgi:hypothetical protein
MPAFDLGIFLFSKSLVCIWQGSEELSGNVFVSFTR